MQVSPIPLATGIECPFNSRVSRCDAFGVKSEAGYWPVMRPLRLAAIALALINAGGAPAAEMSAGVARIKITPPMPFQLSGYSNRTNLATEVRTDLWAKAIAIQDGDGRRAVIVTTDLIGLPREISENVAGRAIERHGLARSQIILNSAHVHSGPMVWPNLPNMFDLTPEQIAPLQQYARSLSDNLTALVDAAIANLAPAKLAIAHDSADFAINRRQATANGFKLGVNPSGPTDHDVPALIVHTPDGRLLAVLFAYACHNTTLTGTWNIIDGDYAGAAQRKVESAHPGCTALFMMLCGGDQNPNPRNTIELAEQHGQTLAAAVERALAGDSKPVRPPIRSAHHLIRLPFATHSRETFVQELQDKNVARQRRARMMLAAYDRGQPVLDVAYPVQAIRFGDDLCLLGLGGEVVVDYALRAKREFPGENLVVAGYCNSVMCYIPTVRILREGGYEPCDSMIFYGQPGPFAESIEETIFQTIRQVMREVGASAQD